VYVLCVADRPSHSLISLSLLSLVNDLSSSSLFVLISRAKSEYAFFLLASTSDTDTVTLHGHLIGDVSEA